jgi:hypothetical protein
MFDQKTAQACWAGPPSQYTIEPPSNGNAPAAEDPFLKGLGKAPLPTTTKAAFHSVKTSKLPSAIAHRSFSKSVPLILYGL